MYVYECSGIRYRKKEIKQRITLSCPSSVYQFMRNKPGVIGPVETLWCLAMNTRNDVMSYFKVSDGTVNCSSLYPGEIAKRLLLINACSAILLHNHPSGSSNPSTHDIQITKQCKQGLTPLGIDLLDHIIMTDSRYTSLSEQGHL